MSDRIEVDPDALAQHGANLAAAVGGVIDECQEAAKMSEGAGFNESYGVIISPIACPIMEKVTSSATEALAAAKEFNEALAMAVEGTAACYAGVDTAVADEFDKLAEELA
ncbi:MAG TPA: type VII secretion target [Glycomyces sp.]|nr:type VII secretion target [Glycomyces sp.]